MADEIYGIGQRVSWREAQGEAEGVVDEVFTTRVTRSIQGRGVTRKASPRRSAYLIRRADGDRLLKSAGEIQAARASSAA